MTLPTHMQESSNTVSRSTPEDNG